MSHHKVKHQWAVDCRPVLIEVLLRHALLPGNQGGDANQLFRMRHLGYGLFRYYILKQQKKVFVDKVSSLNIFLVCS